MVVMVGGHRGCCRVGGGGRWCHRGGGQWSWLSWSTMLAAAAVGIVVGGCRGHRIGGRGGHGWRPLWLSSR